MNFVEGGRRCLLGQNQRFVVLVFVQAGLHNPGFGEDVAVSIVLLHERLLEHIHLVECGLEGLFNG